MRIGTLALSFVSSLTLALPAIAEDSPAASTQSSVHSADAPRAWALDASISRSIGSDGGGPAIGAYRFVGRTFWTESLSIGADLRYWPTDTYPLAKETGTSSWATGLNGQLYLFRTSTWGGYVGASFLWAPTDSQVLFVPEAGLKWFVSRRISLGVVYSILTDIRYYTTSFESPSNGRGRQNLGLELSVYL